MLKPVNTTWTSLDANNPCMHVYGSTDDSTPMSCYGYRVNPMGNGFRNNKGEWIYIYICFNNWSYISVLDFLFEIFSWFSYVFIIVNYWNGYKIHINLSNPPVVDRFNFSVNHNALYQPYRNSFTFCSIASTCFQTDTHLIDMSFLTMIKPYDT